MHGILRMVATELLLATVLAWPGAAAMPAGHATGCHGHEPATPSPAPASYQCCANGHLAALPNLSFSLRVVAAQVSDLDGSDGPGLGLLARLNAAVLVFPSDSPPGPVPLRI